MTRPPASAESMTLMINGSICEKPAEQLPLLFMCEERGEYVRIRTPYLYPDGESSICSANKKAMSSLSQTWERRVAGYVCRAHRQNAP